ncbi:MAG: AAA family ATPase [Bacteroidales bacterium]|nr:AAA family ATPase [Bacteroidales bacterium]
MENNNKYLDLPFINSEHKELFNWVVSMLEKGKDYEGIIHEYSKGKEDVVGIELDYAFIKFALYYLREMGHPDVNPEEENILEMEQFIISQMSEEEKERMLFKYYDTASEKVNNLIENEDEDEEEMPEGETEEGADNSRNVSECNGPEDFERLLDEFIKSQMDEELERMNKNDAEKEGYDEKENVFNEDDDEDDDEDYDDEEDGNEDISGDGIRIVKVNLGASPEKVSPGRLFNLGSCFIFLKRDRYINIEFLYEYYRHNTSYKVELIWTSRHLTLSKYIDGSEISPDNRSFIVTFDGSLLFPFYDQTDTRVEIKLWSNDTNRVIYSESVQFYCANSIYDLLSIKKLTFHSIRRDESIMDIDINRSYIKYNASKTEAICPMCEITNYSGIPLNYANIECLIKSTSDNGNEEYKSGSCYGKHISCELNNYSLYKWEPGSYLFEIRMYGHLFAAASLEIGDVELEGEVDVNTMLRMIRNQELESAAAESSSSGMDELNGLIGLSGIKEKISNFGNIIKLNKVREQHDLKVTKPALHARFIGNPGTGKTTLAGVLGKIYKELGLLSKGHVIYAKRSTLVGRYYDSELRAIEDAVNNAQGGILFIDEAYSLYVEDDPKDPGRKVLEAIMTQLANPKMRDWMLVLAGYGPEMDKLINSNPGLDSRVKDIFYFDDYSIEELMQIAEYFCEKGNFILTPDAKEHLLSVITRDYNSKDENFANARYIHNLFEKVILVNMAKRLNGIALPTKEELQTIIAEDIPSIRKVSKESKGMIGLDRMVGLTELKSSIYSHLNMVKMANMRMAAGIHTNMPPLHMIFTGNPGTGKTTVADFIGEIYASLGILSRGEVIKVERKDIIGSYPGETEENMNSLLSRAKGNILFIDEAYQLAGTPIMDTLLTTLANDNIDMIVILAGYPKEMEELVNSNVGIKSRFPYTFHFEDYSVDELYKIALQRTKDEGYNLTPKAKEYLLALIRKEMLKKRSNFGNARFVTRLLTTQIIPKMADRLLSAEKVPTKEQLTTITKADIPITAEEVAKVAEGGFDQEAIGLALAKLDSLVGLEKAKKAIHDFVNVATLLNSRGEKFVGSGVLKWNFVGNTGTGKSTVAAILAEILKGMNLLEKGNIVEVKAEEIYNVSEYQCDQVLKQAMAKTGYGMLFIDGDAPELRRAGGYHLTNEQLRMKLTSLKAETGNMGALVIAECSSPRQDIANSLAANGIYDYDHIIFFDDYSVDELLGILGKQLGKHKVKFSQEAEVLMKKYIASLAANKDLGLANARTMKLLSRTIYKQVLLRKCEHPDTSDKIVLEEDVKNYVWEGKGKKIGY